MCVLVSYPIHMKRTSLVLDEFLLEQATRALGAKTHSAAVNLALAEILRVRKIQSLAQFFDQGLWRGDLADMREGRPRRGFARYTSLQATDRFAPR
jgi:Arc/MetJ family transcription regulator